MSETLTQHNCASMEVIALTINHTYMEGTNQENPFKVNKGEVKLLKSTTIIHCTSCDF